MNAASRPATPRVLPGFPALPARYVRQVRARRGLSLIEVMVVIAIVVALAAIAVPAVSGYLALEQQRAVRELAVVYERLHDEAVLRNVTFRIAYHLDEGFYEVEFGSPESLIFADPESRERYEEEQESRNRMLSADEKQQMELQSDSSFDKLQDTFATRRELPRNTRFLGVYTPQYGKLIEPNGEGETPAVVYSYIFPNGFAERAIVQIADKADPEEGYTVEVEPLSGRVNLHTEVLSPDALDADYPEEAPKLE